MVKKVYPKEVCMICEQPMQNCTCSALSRKKRLVRYLTQNGKPRPVEDVKEPNGSA